METSLLWFALGVGLVGAVWSAVAAWGLRRGSAASAATLVPFGLGLFVLTALVVAGAVPATPPWAPGMALAIGFALGAWGGFKTVWMAAGPGGDDEPRGVTAASVGPQFEAAAICALCALWLRPDLPTALAGVGIGWSAAVALLTTGAGAAPATAGARAAAARSAAGLVYAVLVCAALTLGNLRDALSPATGRGPWLAAAALAAAAIPTLTFLVGVGAGRAGRVPGAGALASWAARAWPGSDSQAGAGAAGHGLAVTLLYVLLLWLAGGRVPDGHLLPVVGALGGAVGLLLSRLSAADEEAQPATVGALALLVPVAGFMVAGQLLQGFGVAAMALGAVGAAAPAALRRQGADRPGADLLIASMAGLAALTLARAFSARYVTEMRGVWAADAYVILGFLLGVLLPPLLGGLLTLDGGASKSGRLLVRSAAAGVLGLAAAATVPFLWGGKSIPALLAGLVVGVRGPGGREGALRIAVGLGIGLLAYQALSVVLQMDVVARADKVRWLWFCTGALVAAGIADWLAARAAERRAERSAGEA